MRQLLREIDESFKALTRHPKFAAWFKGEAARTGDRIIVNNSFLFRSQTRTKKNELFPMLEVGREGRVQTLPTIASNFGMNTDFKLLSRQSGNLPPEQTLPDALERQLETLGRFVFILIGRIEDDVVISKSLDHATYKTVELNPTQMDRVRVDDSTISVREVFDEEAIWTALLPHLRETDEAALKAMRDALAQGLDALETDAFARLILPQDGHGKAEESVLASFCQVLQEQRDTYDGAFKRSKGEPLVDAASYNELLRIAYNFASDALGVVRLLMSVCDLKPVVFWATVGEHFALSEAFHRLPWTRTRSKPSLDNYAHSIGDARNSVFHHLFPFRKTLEIKLAGTDFKEVTLRLFPEHSRRGENQLLYQDKKLVDVLSEFTRARERQVPPRFWRENLGVMDATIALFHKTAKVLEVLQGMPPST